MIRLRHSDETLPKAICAINVTPFIDVMLLLLVIFMVTVSINTANIAVDLPASSEKPAPAPSHPVYLTIKANHALAVNETEIEDSLLIEKLKNVTKNTPTERIFLSADKTVDYKTLMNIMDQLRQAGFLKVSLVTRVEP